MPAMMAALIAHERNPTVGPTGQVQPPSHRKIVTLEEAFVGRFTDPPSC
jgi:hypothetical protein